MASSKSAPDLPPVSAIQELLNSSKSELAKDLSHPAYLYNLTTQILHNLQYQHFWTQLTIHTHSPLSNIPLPRPMISGLPPRRSYIHPDEQVAIIKGEHESGEKIEQRPEREWVCPSQIQEKWSLKQFSAVFDGLSVVPPVPVKEGSKDDTEEDDEEDILAVGYPWQGVNRQKRLLLATVHDDSTVVYYIMHDGIVKPRQN